MTDLRIVRNTSNVNRGTDDDQWMAARGTRDGSIYVADWIEALALEGRVFCANGGSVTSPLTFGDGVITTTEPDFFLSVPSGTTVIPLEIRIKMEAYGTDALFELMAATGTGGVAGTDTDLTYGTTWGSLRTDEPHTSGCTIGVAADSATATYMTDNICEFWRDGLQKAVTTGTADDDSPMPPQTFVWNRRLAGGGPVMVGASQMMIFASGQATTGFITVIYAEVPSTSIV